MEQGLPARLAFLPAAERVELFESAEQRQLFRSLRRGPLELGGELQELATALARPEDSLLVLTPVLLEGRRGAVEKMASPSAEKLRNVGSKSNRVAELIEHGRQAVVERRSFLDQLTDPEGDRPQAIGARKRSRRVGLGLLLIILGLRNRREGHRQDAAAGDQRADQWIVGIGADQRDREILCDPGRFIHRQVDHRSAPGSRLGKPLGADLQEGSASRAGGPASSSLSARTDALHAVAQLGDFSGEHVDLSVPVKVRDPLDEDHPVGREDRCGLIPPGLEQMRRTDDESPLDGRQARRVEPEPHELPDRVAEETGRKRADQRKRHGGLSGADLGDGLGVLPAGQELETGDDGI
ncbi:MAG TPA: hypothetical protein VGG20_08545, partial [Thermoanaerobaculia bacterium]